MDNATVKQIVANPYHDPEDIVKFYLSRPQYLEEWLAAKGKALAGVSIDCTQCIIANYLKEKLTNDGIKFVELEVTHSSLEVWLEDDLLYISNPKWVKEFIEAIDFHNRQPEDYYIDGHYKTMMVKQQHNFSGNLAKNILKVTLAGLPQAVE